MEGLSTIYLISIVISLAIMIFVIFHEKEITVKDLLIMLLVLVTPIVNIGVFGFAMIKFDLQANGPISKTITFFDKILKIKLKK